MFSVVKSSVMADLCCCELLVWVFSETVTSRYLEKIHVFFLLYNLMS